MRNSIVIMGLVVVVAVIMSSCVTMFAETKVQDNLNLDKKGQYIFFSGQIGKQQGLYKLKLQ